MKGFIFTDYFAQDNDALYDLSRWVKSGQLKVIEDVLDGLESAPAELIGLLAGE